MINQYMMQKAVNYLRFLMNGRMVATGKVMDAIGKAENNENAGRLRGAVLAQISAWEKVIDKIVEKLFLPVYWVMMLGCFGLCEICRTPWMMLSVIVLAAVGIYFVQTGKAG